MNICIVMYFLLYFSLVLRYNLYFYCRPLELSFSNRSFWFQPCKDVSLSNVTIDDGCQSPVSVRISSIKKIIFSIKEIKKLLSLSFNDFFSFFFTKISINNFVFEKIECRSLTFFFSCAVGIKMIPRKRGR